MIPPVSQVIRRAQENQLCNPPSMSAWHVQSARSDRIIIFLLVVAKPARTRTSTWPLPKVSPPGSWERLVQMGAQWPPSSSPVQNCTPSVFGARGPVEALVGGLCSSCHREAWVGAGPWDLGCAPEGQAGSEAWSSERGPVPTSQLLPRHHHLLFCSHNLSAPGEPPKHSK